MATKLANPSGPMLNPHTSGLYADMTLDGPEVGTLVVIVDRAKNLPNKKALGKQNPYCAARLGKEAKKTDTDLRGGQTPRWDQELRFIVHDSPDYQKMKISVFSEDKKTDLIGEAWVDLSEVIVPGGGKNDLWQALQFKGKYAGELRIELTYYDERPRPTEPASTSELQAVGTDAMRVKRRPLPNNPHARQLTPDTIPDKALPGRAKHGPREIRAPPRANSMPPDLDYPHPQPWSAAPADPAYSYSTPPSQAYAPPEQYAEPDRYADGPYGQYRQPDFMPQLPPTSRRSLPMRPPPDTAPPQPQHQSHLVLQHSQSAPVVPVLHEEQRPFEDGYQLRTDYQDPIPDVDYQYRQLQERPRTSGPAPGWHGQHPQHFAGPAELADHSTARPPPPPAHSNSSPIVPRSNLVHHSSPVAPHMTTPRDTRNNLSLQSSPHQTIERNYVTPPRPPMQSSPHAPPSAGYTPPPQPRGYDNPSAGHSPGQTPSPFARQHQAVRQPMTRHSISDPYATTTPSRPHPLSQELPISPYPQPDNRQGYFVPPSQAVEAPPGYQTEYRNCEGLPLIKPRPVSPSVPQTSSLPASASRSRSAYDIQFPIRAFESSNNSPLSTSTLPRLDLASAQTPNRPLATRKSLSPEHQTPHSAGAVPYSPDSFNVHNPNAQASSAAMTPNGTSPLTPYQIRPGSEALPRTPTDGPILGWDGKEVDPSDHLPVDSWAPEPEKKTPVRSYGAGRERDFGPRSSPISNSNSASKSLSKDTVVSVRMGTQVLTAEETPTTPPQSSPTSLRNRLQKKINPSSILKSSPPAQPLQERHNFNSVSVPNPYEQQQQEYSSSFTDRPGSSGAGRQQGYYGSYAAMSQDALSREISNIDLGSGGRHARSGSVPAPTAFVPVRSHKDRKTFY